MSQHPYEHAYQKGPIRDVEGYLRKNRKWDGDTTNKAMNDANGFREAVEWTS